MGTANWDLEDHASEPGPFYQLALSARSSRARVVEGGDIPYKPRPLRSAKESRQPMENDPN